MKMEILTACNLAILLVIWFSHLVSETVTSCYFPDYLEGDYSVQSGIAMQSQVQYTEVHISPDAILPWGFCKKKIGSNLYLIENLSNSSYCIRCFHISIKSPNIIITRTAGNPDRCFISLPAAENSCPKVEYLDATRQMILYKSSKEIRKEPCPIDGKYMIQYKQYKIDHSIECISRSSEISNCPVGSELNIHFQDCPFENHDITFECLGSWSGPNSQHYLALFDTRSSEEPRPKYRCGLYLEDSGSGSIYIAFSSDSTCSTDLKSSQVGFETLVLTPYANSQPQMAACRFPTWLQGQWELVSVDGKVFKYTDTTLFKTYTFQCLSYDESDRRYDFPISGDDDKKILVYGKTQCGEELYSCIWAKKRGPNVFEFQLGMFTSPQYNASLCSSSNFQPNTWITQGRQDYLEDSPCPLLGEYVGTIPNAESLCAKLTSDCSSPDTMFYSVSDCTQIIYEEKRRRYRQVNFVEENNTTSFLPVTLITTNQTQTTSLTNASITIVTVTRAAETGVINFENSTITSQLNDSVAEESNKQNTESSSTEENNVKSYFVENHNIPGFIYEDARFEVPAKTFLPPPISSSTLPPAYQRNYEPTPPPYYNQYDRQYQSYTPYNRNYLPYQQYGTEYFQTQEQQRNTYYNEWNRSRPMMDERSGQMYHADPNPFNRRTIIALPPIQLPPPVTPRQTIISGRSKHKTFKDREYRCLGQWQENGLTYTFTQRKHIGLYECFVGSPLSDSKFSIREAGKYCERVAESPLLSMILTKKSSCAENRTITTVTTVGSSFVPTTQTVPVVVTTMRYTPKKITTHSTKAWKPITNITRPQSPFRSKNTNPNNGIKNVPSQLFTVFICFVFIFDDVFSYQ